ncbi:MAG: radical SAM protein [Thermodesulfobacteriota bacterium]|nr:radical SAM protein [Thermodesulfobacteriota bacterium]
MAYTPVCINSHKTGRLRENAEKAWDMLRHCTLCPRACGADRTAGETGFCRTGDAAVVYSFDAHFGEEAPLSGYNGSGTIFFSHCNLLCNFCQNYDISHKGAGQEVSLDQLAWMMLELQRQGCHNINLVTPSHVVAQILFALDLAVSKGLTLPVIYNTGGYDSVDTLKLLDGAIDIYMPDVKFFHAHAARLAQVPEDYPEIVKKAVAEMHRQAGDLEIDGEGLAKKGLLVRHLVLPGDLAGTGDVMNFLVRQISRNTYVNIMSQYRPCGTAHNVPALARPVTGEAYGKAVDAALKNGISRIDRKII